MIITSIILFILIFILYLIYNQPRSEGFPPGPQGLPLVGNLFDLIGQQPFRYIKRLSDKHGPLFSVQFGLQRVIVITSAGMLHQAMIKKGNAFSSRPKGGVLDLIMSGKGIVMTDGAITTHARKILRHSLKDFGAGKNDIEDHINFELQFFMENLQKNANTVYDPTFDMSVSLLNVTWVIMSGERFSFGDPTVKWLMRSIETSLKLVEAGGFVNYVYLLQLRELICTFCQPMSFEAGIGLFRRFYLFQKSINNHRKNLGNESLRKDFLFLYLEKQESHKALNNNKVDFMYSDSQCRWIMSDVLIAGLETTVTMLRWTFLILVSYPDIQNKLHLEIESIFGSDRSPTVTEKKRLPYTEAFISEMLRLYPSLPMSVRATVQDTELDGYFIPKDTWVFINIYGIHNDTKVWGDPEVVRPERFLNEEGTYERNSNHVPFVLGSKSCVGESLALAELFLFLTTILQKYKIQAADNASGPSLKNEFGFTLIPPETKFKFVPKNLVG